VEVGETMLEETTAPEEAVMEEEVETKTTMARPTAMLRPIRGTLQPLVEEEEVRTASLTPVGHMIAPEKKRGAPPSIGTTETATLKPIRGQLIPVSKTPVKQLKTDEEDNEV